ncbi:MAG: hypothetical protein WAU65_01770 [Candidatus Nanoarchaeia archaeon]
MEIITTRSQLIEKLRDVKTVEIIARENYKEDAITFKNPQIVKTVSQIKLDEDKHIDMLTEIIELLEKN